MGLFSSSRGASGAAGQAATYIDDENTVVVCSDVVREYTRGSGSLFSRNRDAPVVRAVEGVNLTVNRGEVVGLAGPSGSGKSTLLHLLAALETPTSGTVSILGTPTDALSAKKRTRLRRDQIGIIFQRFHLLPSLSARANVALPLVEQGVTKGKRRERATALLKEVGLGDRITHKPSQLSGGEQQRVAVARALASEPALLIADEPTGELDTDTGERVLDMLASLADSRAVVLASHDQQALDRADRVIHLQDGRRIHTDNDG